MINGVLTELFKDENYPIFIRQEIVQTKTDPVLIQSLLEDLNPLLLELKETSNPDTFFGKHYGFIMYNSAKYFSSLRPQFSALILKRLGDKLLQRIKGKQYTGSATEKQQMTEEEMDALSYLAGYVVKKFIIKLSNKKQEDVLNGLRNMVDLTNTENQGLIAAVNRGGLTIVSKDTLKIFKKAEELFREKTLNRTIRSIDTKQIIKDMANDIDIISLFEAAVGISYNENLKNLLKKMLGVYFRVRAISYASDLKTESMLLNKKQKTKKKALRKELKELTDTVI